MKKLVLILLICGSSAFATTVAFSTSAVFSGPDASGGVLKNGTATVSFAGITTPPAPNAPSAPTNWNIGNFITSAGSGTFTNDSVALTITQTLPAHGTGTTSSTIHGTVTSSSNNIDISFSPTTLTIAGVNYTFQQTYYLVPSNSNGGATSLEVFISLATPVPESATLGLFGGSLLGLALLARRRGANKAPLNSQPSASLTGSEPPTMPAADQEKYRN